MRALWILFVALWPTAAFAQDQRPLEYIVRDNGIVCKRGPCPHLDVTAVASGEKFVIGSFDLSPLKLSQAAQDALREEMNRGRVVVLGRLIATGRIGLLIVDRVVRRVPDAR